MIVSSRKQSYYKMKNSYYNRPAIIIDKSLLYIKNTCNSSVQRFMSFIRDKEKSLDFIDICYKT